MGEVHHADIHLSDGNVTRGRIAAVDANGLTMEAAIRTSPQAAANTPSAGDSVPFDRVSTIKLYLDRSRGWQVFGGVVGGIVVGQIALSLNFESPHVEAITLTGVSVGAVAGALWGGKHRKTLTIEVTK
jgi:hypothetical protein